MKPLVFEPRDDVGEVLEEWLDVKLRETLKLPPKEPKGAPGATPFVAWSETAEGRIHMSLMHKYVFTAPTVTAKSATRIQRMLQSRGQETRGRPPTYDDRIRDGKTTRMLKVYFLNLLVAKGLGLDVSEWEPPLVPTESMPESKPTDTYSMLERFETWTQFSLPKAAWLLYTKADRIKAAESCECTRDADGAMEFLEYRSWRSTRTTKLQLAA